MTNLRFSPFIALTLALCGCKDQDTGPNGNWVTQIGGPGGEVVYDLVETSDGRLCATGTFFVRAEFGGGARTTLLETSEAQDIFLACYQADGQLDFATRFGTRRGSQPRALAALPGGDIVMTGFFSDALGAGANPGLVAEGDGNAEIFLTRIDRNGNEVWAQSLGSRRADSGNALAVDASGNILLAGSYQEAFVYPTAAGMRKLNSVGQRDAFVMKLDGDGTVLWATSFGGSGSDEARGVATGVRGEVYVTGSFAGVAGQDAHRLTARAYDDIFVLGLTADGTLSWSRQLEGEGQDTVAGLVVDTQGRVVVAGNFQGTLTLDGDRQTSAGSTDGFVARFDGNGTPRQLATFGGQDVELVYGLAAAPTGHVLVTGHFQGNTDFAPGAATETRTGTGGVNTDAFLLVLDGDLGYHDVKTIGGEGVEVIATAVATHRGVTLAGMFGKDLRIPGIDTEGVQCRGKSDVFLTRHSEIR